MIDIRGLYKSFEDKTVLSDINASFENGKTNLIIGQSGSGKTVLMKCIVGLLTPEKGEVLYDGRNLVLMGKKEKKMLRKEMGMIFQSAALFDSMSVLDNVMFPLNMFSNDTPVSYTHLLQAACCGFLYLMETAANFIRSGRYKKIIIVGADKMSSMVNYTDRATCPIFGDGAAAFMMEPTTEDLGVMDSILRTDGKGLPFLHMKAGGSVCPPSYFTVDNKMHYLHQEGRTVFKYAVSSMSDVSAAIAEKNGLTKDTINWVVPHQANVRIIEAVAHRMELPMDKVLVNIEHYGNTSAATLPLCIWDFEDKLKKGDNIIFTAFGAGFTWGAVYVKWGYDGKKES